MLEDFPGIVIGDAVVFDFPGMEGESYAVAVQGFGQSGVRGYAFLMP